MVNINDLFDNIENVTSLEDNEHALDFARQLIFENNDISSDEDFFDEQD
ncbi:10545_t:CDS:1, partial [Funneliformis caledonium]